jgi:hypothetical protein
VCDVRPARPAPKPLAEATSGPFTPPGPDPPADRPNHADAPDTFLPVPTTQLADADTADTTFTLVELLLPGTDDAASARQPDTPPPAASAGPRLPTYHDAYTIPDWTAARTEREQIRDQLAATLYQQYYLEQLANDESNRAAADALCSDTSLLARYGGAQPPAPLWAASTAPPPEPAAPGCAARIPPSPSSTKLLLEISLSSGDDEEPPAPPMLRALLAPDTCAPAMNGARGSRLRLSRRPPPGAALPSAATPPDLARPEALAAGGLAYADHADTAPPGGPPPPGRPPPRGRPPPGRQLSRPRRPDLNTRRAHIDRR